MCSSIYTHVCTLTYYMYANYEYRPVYLIYIFMCVYDMFIICKHECVYVYIFK